jgi:hypothetical protein
MSKEQDKTEKLNVILKGEAADRFKRIKTFLGLEQDTEVIRTLIAWYYNQHQNELTGPPKTMWHVNLNDDGVLIWDPDLGKAVQVDFKRTGILCAHDQKDDCKHIQFALSKREIQDVIRKRRKEGWKLPNP